MSDRKAAFRQAQRDMAYFSRHLVGMPLYPYQTTWADYALQTVAAGNIETITVEMPRQSGKNETSAQMEVAILARMGRKGGTIVKCAPTFKPQIVNSKERFGQRADMVTERAKWLKFTPSMGYIFKCERAQIHLLSADPKASVVGATASLMLEVDEAQDVDIPTFDKKFSPMRASKGSPIVAYGTTWTDNTLLERFKRDVLEGRSKGRIYRILPDEVALSNPAYGEFVDSEVGRLGRQHPIVKTQYFLEPLPGAGRMLSRQQLELMVGDHPRQERRASAGSAGDGLIVAGLDFAGADEQAGELVSLATASARDSVALAIGAVTWVRVADGLQVPHIRVLARYEWVNIDPVTLHNVLYQILWERWRVNRVHCDATGIGATGTALLQKALNKNNREIVTGVTFDAAWNTQTKLAFNYLAAINNGHLQDYQPAQVDPLAIAGADLPPTDDPHSHIWWQRGHAKLEAKPSRRVRAYVPESEGHDDLLVSDMLMVDAAYAVGLPAVMTGSNVDFYAPTVGTAPAPMPARSDAEIERMLDGHNLGT